MPIPRGGSPRRRNRSGLRDLGRGISRSLGCASRVLRLFPIAPVKEVARFQQRGTDVVETAGIDADLVGIRARHIEGMHAAIPAEGVLRGVGVELVGFERLLALQ